MRPIGLPGWLRIALVAGVAVLVAGACLFGYRWYSHPTMLSIAVGSLDGEAGRIANAIAGRLAEKKVEVRLNVVETSGALEAANAFSSGKTDLAIVRGDVGDLSRAQAVIVVARAVALLVALPPAIDGLAELKRATIGVLGGETNRKLVSVLTNEYDLGRANVNTHALPGSQGARRIRQDIDRGVNDLRRAQSPRLDQNHSAFDDCRFDTREIDRRALAGNCLLYR